eukprot:m51a1_g12875 putative zinc finger protein constans-like 3 (276) ;mRNA; f:1824-3225
MSSSALLCDGCASAPASLCCASCRALLCPACDARAHSLRFASAHRRAPLAECAGCGVTSADVFCRQCAACLCAACDGRAHGLNYARSHRRDALGAAGSAASPPTTTSPPLECEWKWSTGSCCCLSGSTASKTGMFCQWDSTVVASPSITRSTRFAVTLARVNALAHIMVGVAPASIDPYARDNHRSSGWYLYCHNRTLYSGQPQALANAAVPAWGDDARPLAQGSRVVVEVDVARGSVSFECEGGRAVIEGVPVQQPLVPAVLLRFPGDTVEIAP